MIIIEIIKPSKLEKESPNNEHDMGYKDIFYKKSHFLHFLRKYIGKSWAEDISEDDLILMNTSFVLPDHKGKECDVIYRAKQRKRRYFLRIIGITVTCGFYNAISLT